MYALALLVIGVSGFISFAKVRDGADPARGIGDGVLVAATFSVLVAGAALWLAGAEVPAVAELALSIVGSSFLAALIGAFSASFNPRREPAAHW